MRRAISSSAALFLAACGGEAASVDAAAGDAAVAPAPDRKTGFTGLLTLESNDPMEAVRIIRYDFATGRHYVEIDGAEARRAGPKIAFVQACGDSGTGERVSILDADGFTTPASPCEGDRLTTNLHSVALSPDGRRVAAVDTEMPISLPRNASALARWSAPKGQGVRLYAADGEEIAAFPGYGAPAWTRAGALVMAGTGRSGEAPYGIYKASPDFSTADRIDDGRLNGAVASLAAHPNADRMLFVHNSQIWEIDLTSGAPQRRIVYERPIAAAAYSPDGAQIVFIVVDPVSERVERRDGGPYYLHVFDGDDITDVSIDFAPGGPLTWTRD